MKEDDHIDNLFRSHLLHQDIPMDNHALKEAMNILDSRKRKNVRVIYWISGLLGLLAIGVGLAFFFCRTDVPSKEQKIELPLAPSSSTENDLADSSENNRNSTSDDPLIQSEVETGIHDSGVMSKESDIASSPSVKSISRSTENSVMKSKGNIGANETTGSNQNEIDKPSEKSYQIEAGEGASLVIDLKDIAEKSETDNKAEDQAQSGLELSGESENGVQSNNYKSFEAEKTDAVASDDAFVRPTETVTNSEVVQSEIPLDSIVSVEILMDSSLHNDDLLKPEFKSQAFSKWDIRLAGSGFQTYSTIGQRNLYEDVYAQQRNQQETSLTGYGVDVSLSRNSERSFVSLGLGYMQTREDIQYAATKTEQEITSENFWEYESVLYMIVDGTGTNLNSIVWDTSFMEVNVDSTLFVTYDTTTTTTENTAITTFNGIAKWSHLYLPLVYGIRLDHKTKSSLYAVGSVELNYLASTTAHYLTTDGQSVQSMLNYPGYRRFMINGSVGIEWRKLLGGERMYLLVNPGLRANLYSWNADFKHNTFSPFVRAGIGWRFQEK
jgi:hypothetical protein